MDKQRARDTSVNGQEQAGKIAATPGHVKAQAQKESGKAETGGQVAREIAGGKKDEITDRTGRYR